MLTVDREHNADAIAYNTTADRQTRLLPFYNPGTNEPIRGFPNTSERINTMEREYKLWRKLSMSAKLTDHSCTSPARICDPHT